MEVWATYTSQQNCFESLGEEAKQHSQPECQPVRAVSAAFLLSKRTGLSLHIAAFGWMMFRNLDCYFCVAEAVRSEKAAQRSLSVEFENACRSAITRLRDATVSWTRHCVFTTRFLALSVPALGAKCRCVVCGLGDQLGVTKPDGNRGKGDRNY